ncbi:MAG: AGE family epimerase/isomerase [Bacteroidales bacterium]|nr:AGE family epimerase/isomerase [Bacteroidales bacterium]
MKWLRVGSAVVILTVLLSSCKNNSAGTSKVFSGNYWKEQALTDIIPFWSKYSQDTISGAFITNLDSIWLPFGSSDKYPSMISRHLFSYSVAYLLSGDEENLIIAHNTVKWLLDHAWDKEYGGWFDALDEKGNPVQMTKNTFVQVYTITGLAMYYFVTHDSTVLKYIDKSNELLETKVWDYNAGGYFNMMNRDWSVSDSNKSFSSQITPVSGYLIYLYQATRDPKYLKQINKILEVTINNMVDKESGWVLESFDKNWKYLPGKEDETEINIGHNIETSWMLLRDYLITGNLNHLNSAKSLSQKINKYGLLQDKDFWLSNIGRTPLLAFRPDTYWWVQAYGNMFDLYLYHISGEKKYLNEFQGGAVFWDSAFMDKIHGDTYLGVDTAGAIIDGKKATQFKTSYHSMEHCLLNLLCLNLWVNDEPVELHFRITSSRDGEMLFPLPLEDNSIEILKVTMGNKDQTSLIADHQSVRLPLLSNTKIAVQLGNHKKLKK